MATLDELTTYLAATLSGYVAGTNLIAGDLPPDPDVVTTVKEGPGYPMTHAMASAAGSPLVENPSVQVLCRGARWDYAGPRAEAQRILKALTGLPTTVISGVTWYSVVALQSPFEITRDANERVVIGCNYQVKKALSA